jgi:hypothetical protein
LDYHQVDCGVLSMALEFKEGGAASWRSESGSRIGIRKFGSGMPKIVRQHPDVYRRISQILDRHSEILEAVSADLAVLSAPGNKRREANFTAENLLRALLVMSRQGLTFRETILQIADNGFLQDFVRLRKKLKRAWSGPVSRVLYPGEIPAGLMAISLGRRLLAASSSPPGSR